MAFKLSLKRASTQDSVVRSAPSCLPSYEPTIDVLRDSSSEDAYSNSQEAAVVPNLLLSKKEVISRLNAYYFIMRQPRPLLNCSISFDLAYHLLRYENALEDKIIPKQKNKRMPQDNGGGVFFYSQRDENYTAVGTGHPIDFSGKRTKRFSAALGISEQNNCDKTKTGLTGRQYQLLDRNGTPFGPYLIIAQPEPNSKWRVMTPSTDKALVGRPIDESTRNSKIARNGNRLDASSTASSKNHKITSTDVTDESIWQFNTDSTGDQYPVLEDSLLFPPLITSTPESVGLLEIMATKYDLSVKYAEDAPTKKYCVHCTVTDASRAEITRGVGTDVTSHEVAKSKAAADVYNTLSYIYTS